MKLHSILFVLLLVQAGAGAAGTLYRWVDSDGHVHYSDQPPPPSVKNSEEKKTGGSVIEGGQPYVLQQAVKNFPLTFYATPECGEGCTKAREFLNKRGVPFTEKNPRQPAEAEALKKIAGEVVVPVLAVGNTQPLKGFDESAWNNALDATGYPRTPLPGASATSAPNAKTQSKT